MPEFCVVLVEPQNPGNLGAIARAMMNFGVKELILVNPCPIDDVAYQRAMHAEEILKNAKIFNNFEDAVNGIDFLAGTSGVPSANEKHHLRIPLNPTKFVELASQTKGKIGIVFGRENFGLSNEELARCDVLVNIPTAPEYPIMNISHAVAVLLYEIYNPAQAVSASLELHEASGEEKERFFAQLHEYLVAVDHPEFKMENTEIMVRRIFGRAGMSKWEFYTLMGILGDGVKTIKRTQKTEKSLENEKLPQN
ncbi:MAG: RNA methyltransferase [Candidatus Thermoplasmatota archaeon]|nr:RNA methyltransferase [Candidatus Thermoplasmatota archaeon]